MNEPQETPGRDHPEEVAPPPKRPESLKARQASDLYRELREKRSLKEVARMLGKDISQIGLWSRKYGWCGRAAAFDAELERIALEAAAVAARAEAAQWEQRRQKHRERLYTEGEQFMDQGKAMRAVPLMEVRRVVEVDETGRETHVQIFKPARWSKRDALAFTKGGAECEYSQSSPPWVEGCRASAPRFPERKPR